MAELTGKAISELPAATSIGDSDLLTLSQGGASKKITPPVLLTGVQKTRTDITTAPSSVDELMSYLPGAYRIAISGSQSIFPTGYGILEIVHGGRSYGLARFTPVSSTVYLAWTRLWNKYNSTWYDTSWKPSVDYPTSIANGGTGATSVSGAKAALGFVDTLAVNSLVTDYTIDTTQTNTVNTYNSRKFSDYSLLLFMCGSSNSNARVTSIIPSSTWQSGYTVFLIGNHGTNLASASSVTFTYASDTSVYVTADGAKAFNHCQIMGIRLT